MQHLLFHFLPLLCLGYLPHLLALAVVADQEFS